MRGQWLDGAGPDGLVCVHVPTYGSDGTNFFHSLAQFIDQWKCQNFLSLGILMRYCYRKKHGELMVWVRLRTSSFGLWIP